MPRIGEICGEVEAQRFTLAIGKLLVCTCFRKYYIAREMMLDDLGLEIRQLSFSFHSLSPFRLLRVRVGVVEI